MKSFRIISPCALLILCGLVDWSHSHPLHTSSFELEGDAVKLSAGNVQGDDKISVAESVIADANSGHKADPSSNMLKSVDPERNQNAVKAGDDFKSLSGDVARGSQTNKAGEPKTQTEGERQTFLKKIRSFFLDGPVKLWRKIKQWFSSRTKNLQADSKNLEPLSKEEDNLATNQQSYRATLEKPEQQGGPPSFDSDRKEESHSKMNPEQGKKSVGIQEHKEQRPQQDMNKTFQSKVAAPTTASELEISDEDVKELMEHFEDEMTKHGLDLDRLKKLTLEQKKTNPSTVGEPDLPLKSSTKQSILDFSERIIEDQIRRHSASLDKIDTLLKEEETQHPAISSKPSVNDLAPSPKHSEIPKGVAPITTSSSALSVEEVRQLEIRKNELQDAVHRYSQCLEVIQKARLESTHKNILLLKELPSPLLELIQETAGQVLKEPIHPRAV
ncbi:hypothetical protein DFH28DRAFT_947221 [Melampsora americana]|nr:hypothetical protein DFH28DRAFT_947221 [Melampsora americana]